MRIKRWVGPVLLGLLIALLAGGCGTQSYPISVEPATDGNVELARQALVSFFDRLSVGDYGGASEWYGGSYAVLAGYNPDVGLENHEELFRNACTLNGFQCLPVRSARQVGGSADAGEYKFSVEFSIANGELFVLGPCCGATEAEQPAQSEFVFRVVEVAEGEYHVLDLPVYVP